MYWCRRALSVAEQACRRPFSLLNDTPFCKKSSFRDKSKDVTNIYCKCVFLKPPNQRGRQIHSKRPLICTLDFYISPTVTKTMSNICQHLSIYYVYIWYNLVMYLHTIYSVLSGLRLEAILYGPLGKIQ